MGQRQRFPRHLSRFFRWWFGTNTSTTRHVRYIYRESKRGRSGECKDINVGTQPIGDIGATHNPDLSGSRWVEPLPTFDDALDSWDDAVYLGASWERFIEADEVDPFTPVGRPWTQVEVSMGNEHRWGRLT